MERAEYKKMTAAVFITGGLLGAGYAIGRHRRGACREYHPIGFNREECDRQDYSRHIKKLRRRLDEAYQQMQGGQGRDAVFDTRTVMEEAVKLLNRITTAQEMNIFYIQTFPTASLSVQII